MQAAVAEVYEVRAGSVCRPGRRGPLFPGGPDRGDCPAPGPRYRPGGRPLRGPAAGQAAGGGPEGPGCCPQELANTERDLEAAQEEAERQEDDAELAKGELDFFRGHLPREVEFARQEARQQAIREMRAGGPPHATSLQTVVDFVFVAVTRYCRAVPGMNGVTGQSSQYAQPQLLSY